MVGAVDVDWRVLRRQLGHVWILGVLVRVGQGGGRGTKGDFLCVKRMTDTVSKSSRNASRQSE